MGRKSGPPVSDKEAQERQIRKAEKKAKKAARRSIVREAKAQGQAKESGGSSGGIQKDEYGQDIFDGKVHAKWPALFKKHLEYLESHIKVLDRVMQAMQSEMKKMGEEQRREFELGGDSKWRIVCGLMDRARETLVAARLASHTIIPPSWQKDRAGLGVTGFKFERLLPRLQKKAEAGGYFWGDNRLDSLWGDSTRQRDESSNSRSESSSAEEGSSGESESDRDDSDVSDSKAEGEGTKSGGDKSARPLFFIDTNPTPVNIDGLMPEKSTKDKRPKKDKKPEPVSAESTPSNRSKKRPSEDPEESNSTKKSKVSPPGLSNVDFTAIEAQLQAEVEAGLKAKEQELQDQAHRREKKRKRNSDGVQAVVDSFKKKQKLELREKVKTVASAASEDSPAKERKKGKKRKAENGEDEATSKKARGHD